MLPNNNIIKITSHNVPYVVRVVIKGDKYGMHPEGIVHDKEEPLVEFYDNRKEASLLGDFLARYSLSYVLATDTFNFNSDNDNYYILDEDITHLRSLLNKNKNVIDYVLNDYNKNNNTTFKLK